MRRRSLAFPARPKAWWSPSRPSEIVTHYEAAFRSAGLQPGLVTVSSLAMLDLLPFHRGSYLVARRSTGVLDSPGSSKTALVTLTRALELSEDLTDPLEEIGRRRLPDARLSRGPDRQASGASNPRGGFGAESDISRHPSLSRLRCPGGRNPRPAPRLGRIPVIPRRTLGGKPHDDLKSVRNAGGAGAFACHGVPRA